MVKETEGQVMHILELSSRTGNRHAEIHMDYDDIRDTANAMYELYKAGHKNYGALYLGWKKVLDMVKHGNVMPGTMGLAMERSGGKDGKGTDAVVPGKEKDEEGTVHKHGRRAQPVRTRS